MGLNPPFGVRGALANQFINHALKFKPKLLVFIVPKETERYIQILLSENFLPIHKWILLFGPPHNPYYPSYKCC